MLDFTLTRDRDGVSAETSIPLGVDRRELRITTNKFTRGLWCQANVVQLAEDGRGFSFVLHQDYSKVLAKDPAARATKNNICAMHARALANIEPVLVEVRAQYPGAFEDRWHQKVPA